MSPIAALEFVAEPRPHGGWDARRLGQFLRPLGHLLRGAIGARPGLLPRRQGHQTTYSRSRRMYCSAFEQEQQREQQQRAERRLAFETAMAAARDQLTSGDFEGAMNLLEQARSLHPLAVDPSYCWNETCRAMECKRLKDDADYASACEEGAALNVACAHTTVRSGPMERAQRQAAARSARRHQLNAILLKKKDREKFHALGTSGQGPGPCTGRIEGNSGRGGDGSCWCLKRGSRWRRGSAARSCRCSIPYWRTPLPRCAVTVPCLEKSNVPDQQQAAVADYYSLMLHDPWSPSYHHRLARLLCYTQGNVMRPWKCWSKRRPRRRTMRRHTTRWGFSWAHRARHAGRPRTLHLLGRSN